MAIKFDLSLFPNNSKINKATLSLFIYDGYLDQNWFNNGPKDLFAWKSDWTESSLTWKNAPEFTAAITSNSNTNLWGWEDFDVTEYVKGVIKNGDSNYGFMLQHSTTSHGALYRSSEYAEVEYRPKLIISYDGSTEIDHKTEISHILPKQTYTVTVTNVQGRTIASCKTSDLNRLTETLPSGLNIVHIKAAGRTITKKSFFVK